MYFCTYRPENSIVNQITTTISILSSISIAWSSYSSIVQKTLKAKHVNTIINLICVHSVWIIELFSNSNIKILQPLPATNNRSSRSSIYPVMTHFDWNNKTMFEKEKKIYMYIRKYQIISSQYRHTKQNMCIILNLRIVKCHT